MTDLLSQFADPQAIHTMSIADKLLAGLFTTILGMGITFMALIILQFIISWMDRLINSRKQISLPQPEPQVKVEPANAPAPVPEPAPVLPAEADNNEIVAAIAAAIGAMLGTSSDQIVVKNFTIVKVKERSPVWNQIGILEQMSNRL